MQELISDIRISKHSYPLIKPYILSFTAISNITSLRVQISLSDRQKKIAEVVPLFGYSHEREEDINSYLEEKKKYF